MPELKIREGSLVLELWAQKGNEQGQDLELVWCWAFPDRTPNDLKISVWGKEANGCSPPAYLIKREGDEANEVRVTLRAP
jgi:hypothetical protein